MGHASVSAHWLKNFYTAIAAALMILLSSCSGLKVPNTLHITFGANLKTFKDDIATNQELMSTWFTEPFKRSNPQTQIIYITYPLSDFNKQIKLDSKLNLGPDLIIVRGLNGIDPHEFSNENITATLPDEEYFDAIYDAQVQFTAKDNGKYSFAPVVVSAQFACFNNTNIKQSPETIQDLEALSARGQKIGLSYDPYTLLWSAGAHGAITEISSIGNQTTGDQQNYPAIKAWLEWVHKAALYQNIIFESNELLTKNFKDKKLDWITCRSEQFEELKNKLGNSLSIAALPNGSQSRASPTI